MISREEKPGITSNLHLHALYIRNILTDKNAGFTYVPFFTVVWIQVDFWAATSCKNYKVMKNYLALLQPYTFM